MTLIGQNEKTNEIALRMLSVTEYARRFTQGHRSFLGLGSEKKWYETHVNKLDGESVPLFRSGGGLLNHIGGTYPHGGMIDCTRFPISELHLGNFLDFVEFQSWKVNFKTEVCSRSAKSSSQCTGSKKLR